MVGAAALTTLLVVVLAGCGSSNSTPDTTTTPEPTTSSVDTTPTTTTTETEPLKPGSAERGTQVFAASCEGCHAALGTKKAFGPQLSGSGLTEAFIRDRVTNGKAPSMPAGRVTGQEFEDVVAYVLSIQ